MKKSIRNRRDTAYCRGLVAREAENQIIKLLSKRNLTPDDLHKIQELRQRAIEYREEEHRYLVTAQICGDSYVCIKPLG